MRSIFRQILLILLFLSVFVTSIGYIMNYTEIMKYKEEGITIPAYIINKETYLQRTGKKNPQSEVNRIKLRFSINGIPGTTFVSNYISETEMETYQNEQKVDMVYLKNSVYFANGVVSLISPAMLKTTIKNGLERLSWYPLIGGFSLLSALLILLIPKLIPK